MNHRPLSALVLVAVVVLAGCSGGIPFSDDGASENRTATAPATTAQPAATDLSTIVEPTRTPTAAITKQSTSTSAERTLTTTMTDGEVQITTTAPTAATTEIESNTASFPPGYSASGITNPKRAVTHHFTALFSHDNFTYTTKSPIFTTGRAVFVFRTDLAEKRMYGTADVTAPDRQPRHVEEYRIKNISYTARFSNGTPRYFFTITKPFTPYVSGALGKSPDSSSMLSEVVRNARFDDATRVTRNGETFLRYESTALLNKTAILPVQATNASVNAFNATVLVDEEGIIRSASYSITYTKSNGRRVMANGTTRISRINDTTIEKPAWLNKAKRRMNQSSTGTGTENVTTDEPAVDFKSPVHMGKSSMSALSVQDNLPC